MTAVAGWSQGPDGGAWPWLAEYMHYAYWGAFLNETIDDLTVQFEENGQVIVNELDKVVLSKGAWTTILFRYQQWQPDKDSFGGDMYVIRRYKKAGGEYRQQSKFNISSADQARKIVDALSSWIN